MASAPQGVYLLASQVEEAYAIFVPPVRLRPEGYFVHLSLRLASIRAIYCAVLNTGGKERMLFANLSSGHSEEVIIR